MSKNNIERGIRIELDRLNEVIDRKIMRGVTYRKEAERHSFLRARLAQVSRSRIFSRNWFGRSLGFVNTFFL